MVNPFAGARFVMSGADLLDLPAPDRPELAFAGRSNAGKSSALNALCGQTGLARVSKTPGRTQLINFFELADSRLVDLPGYGYADVPERARRDWGRLVSGFIEFRESLVGIVLIMDARHPLKDFDLQMLAWAGAQQLRCHVLLTKADKLAGGAARKTLRDVGTEVGGQASVQLFSSKDGTGLEEARATLHEWIRSTPVGT
jgi:GTP-binding protein